MSKITLKRFSLVTVFMLFSVLSADDSFSCQISMEQQSTIWTLLPLEENDGFEDFTQSSIDIVATQDGVDFDDLIVKTIKELVKEIDPEKAAQMYVDSIKNIFSKAMDAADIQSIVASENEDEAKQALGNFIQKIFSVITSKDVVLEQSIYLAAFSDELVKNITNAMSVCMQDYKVKVSQLGQTVALENIASEMKNVMNDYLTNCLNSVVAVLEDHGYKIDRQNLAL